MMRALIMALVMTGASGALADTVPLPDEYVPEEGRELFRLCRAAILVEIRADESDRTPLPVEAVKAMREQIEFIMVETIFSAPALNLEDGERRLEFTERFILDFGKTVGAERERLENKDERTAILLQCQPLIWMIVKGNTPQD